MSAFALYRPLFLAAVIALPSPAAMASDPPEENRPYDFKGLELGMTPTQFKSLLDIRPTYLHLRSGQFVTALAACTDDEKGRSMHLPVHLAKNGGVMCGWIKGTSAYGEPAPPTVGEFNAKSYSLSFISKDDDREPRLFDMSFSINSDSFYNIKSGLIRRFGDPVESEVEKLQNRMGATFESNVLRWSNGISSITLHQRFGRVDEGFLKYRLNEYGTYADDLKAVEDQHTGPDL